MSATPQDFDKFESEFKVLDETELDNNESNDDSNDSEQDDDKTVQDQKELQIAAAMAVDDEAPEKVSEAEQESSDAESSDSDEEEKENSHHSE